jgi:thiol-disulfide isomerase/thioredoxin
MRSPIVIGVIAALAVGSVALFALLSWAVADPPAAPTPAVPTPPSIALPTDEPTDSPVPTGTAGAPSPGTSPTDEPTLPPDDGIGLGEMAPRIELPALGGGTFDTSAYEGRPLWINFMATWCPQCVDELPMMELMQEELGDSLQILIVDVGEDEEIVAAFIEGLDVSLPVGLDGDAEVQREWGAWVLPQHFWLDEEGVIKAILFGGAPRDFFIESILSVVPDAELE